MSYTKTTWVNDQAPAINATNLNKIETGIFNNDSMLTSILTTLGINTTTWVSTDTYVEGQAVVYNNELYKNITGNYTTTDPATDTTNWMKTTMLDIQYPVGKTEIFYDDLDHTNYLGFTWEKYAAGRCLVGKDANDSDFDTIGETGGSKTHSHSYRGITTTDQVSGAGVIGTQNNTTDSSSLQPYIVVNIWKRVS